jgi:hypothetical protein
VSAAYTELRLTPPVPDEEQPPLPGGTWTLQKSKRPKGTYYQAVHGTKANRVTVTLGYMSPEDADRALANLRSWGSRLVALDRHGRRRVDDDVIRGIALGSADTVRSADDILAEAVAARKVRERDYLAMTLREYHDSTWWPYREITRDDSTVERERKCWRDILAALGHVRVTGLDQHTWSMFLAGHEGKWSARTRALTQNAYRCALTYLSELTRDANGNPTYRPHGFDRIKGSSKPTLPPGEALSAADVDALLGAADDDMHRALFAITFGMGLRPSEPTGKPSKRSPTGWKGGLDWSYFDWSARRLKVPGTKNAMAEAVVPMSDSVHAEMRRWWEACGRPDSGMVFLHEGKPIANWRKAFVGAVRRARIDPDGRRRIIRYSGRYTFATLSAVHGVGEAATRKAMRHSSRSQILERVYERLSIDQTAEALRALPSFGVAVREAEAEVTSAPPARSKARDL